MSGRGGRGGGASTTVRAVANALGISRHEMAAYQQGNSGKGDEPVLYPKLARTVLEFDNDAKQSYMAHLKLEIANRFHESEFYLDAEEKRDIRRYTDKYNLVQRDKFQPEFSRVPEELCWVRDASKASKRRKTDDVTSDAIAERLRRLEEREGGEREGETEETREGAEKEAEEEDGSEKSFVDENGAGSDSDALEDETDYVNAHFDNGEGYDNSDDNMDGDEY